MRILNNIITVIAVISAITVAGCSQEIDLDNYRQQEGCDMPVINSIVTPDSIICVKATHTYYWADNRPSINPITNLDLHLIVNDQPKGKFIYDIDRRLYVSTFIPKPCDCISVAGSYMGKHIGASDTIPKQVHIENIAVERQGPMSIYYDNDYMMTYRITFTDPIGVGDCYYLKYDFTGNLGTGIRMGERVYKYEYVFLQLANQVRPILPGWEPYSPDGLPFCDTDIDGKTHTLVVKEIVSDPNRLYPGFAQHMEMGRRFTLYGISRAYYDYLVSCLCNYNSDGGIGTGMIDLGIADPVKVYSNIIGGTGILGCYTTDSRIINVIEQVGPFPK